ncbi:MAG: TerC family protein [Bacteroidetes bacterium]|nr:TerC family protein [Bacteroidota bacterium]
MKELQELFTTTGLSGLLALTLMEIMLGIDNVIFVSIILGKLKTEQEKKTASTTWMIAGMIIRLILLYVLGTFLKSERGLFTIWQHPVLLKDIIMIGGGVFLLINTTLEIHNKLEGEDPNEAIAHNKRGNSFKAIIWQIILVDFIFSVDGIITSIGMSELDTVRYAAVIISMLVMFVFARKISRFINQHPTFKMLALSFLMLIAFTLIVDGVHVEEFEIPHGYVYFAMAFSLGVEILNLQLRKKTKKPVELRSPTIDKKGDDNLP